MKTTIVKTVLSENEEILITAIAVKEALSDNYKVYCHYNHTYNPSLQFDVDDTESEQFKNAFAKIEKWCKKNNHTLWSY